MGPLTHSALPIAALDDAVLVEFVSLNGSLHAITVCGHRVRLHPLGPESEIKDLLRRLGFALHRLASPAKRAVGPRIAAAKADLARVADLLDEPAAAPVGLGSPGPSDWSSCRRGSSCSRSPGRSSRRAPRGRSR